MSRSINFIIGKTLTYLQFLTNHTWIILIATCVLPLPVGAMITQLSPLKALSANSS